MNRYCLSVSVPFRKGSDNKTLASLTDELLNLAHEFGGRGDPMCRSSSTTYERRYLGLVDREHQLEVKVNELKKKYSNDLARFTLAEYTMDGVGRGKSQVEGRAYLVQGGNTDS